MMSPPLSSSMFRRLAVLVVAAIALSCAPLFAHDMWIVPTTFSPEPGEIVGVRFRVGQHLLSDPLPRDPALVNQFVVEDAAGRKPVYGRDGADPAGLLRVAMPGLLVIGYRSNPSAIELAAEAFNQYVKEEGLDAVAALRARRNETGAIAHELFSRCAKAWCCRDRRATRRAIGASVFRSNSWSNGIRTQSAPVRICPFAATAIWAGRRQRHSIGLSLRRRPSTCRSVSSISSLSAADWSFQSARFLSG
jgi:hypothetical protein